MFRKSQIFLFNLFYHNYFISWGTCVKVAKLYGCFVWLFLFSLAKNHDVEEYQYNIKSFFTANNDRPWFYAIGIFQLVPTGDYFACVSL